MPAEHPVRQRDAAIGMLQCIRRIKWQHPYSQIIFYVHLLAVAVRVARTYRPKFVGDRKKLRVNLDRRVWLARLKHQVGSPSLAFEPASHQNRLVWVLLIYRKQ